MDPATNGQQNGKQDVERDEDNSNMAVKYPHHFDLPEFMRRYPIVTG